MTHFDWRWFAVSSLWLASLLVPATAATRPQYGETLHVAMRESPMSLDPSDDMQQDSFGRRNVLELIFETLVKVDDRGRARPALATGWSAAPGNQRWQFTLRRGVKFHDGSALTPEIAASSLRSANPSWKVLAEGDSVVVERDRPDADLPAELALIRNSILKRDGGGKLSGTGPFHVEDWNPGMHLTLGAEENPWRGRPFLSAIEIEMGRNFHEQLIELETGKADLVEVAPEQAHRVTMEGRRVIGSQPVELVALIFSRDPKTDDEKRLRRALAESIERNSMRSVLLQGAGRPAACLLPDWMTGYGFTFSTEADLKQARHERDQVHTLPDWTVGYDANDSLARVLVDRITLNARDAGLALHSTTSAAAYLRLVRIPLAWADPQIALTSLAEVLGLVMPAISEYSAENLYSAEQTLLTGQRVIPLFHLPVEWASSPELKDWRPGTGGSWRLDEAWMEKGKP
jgi:ABC-type transport system substrate-binding protein